MKKQNGFALITGMLILVTIVGFGSMAIAEYTQKKRILNNAESFYNRVLYLRRQVHAYANDKYTEGFSINSSFIFPDHLSDLEGNYVPECSTADNHRGLCMTVDQTPWGKIDYKIERESQHQGTPYYRAVLDIPLPSKADKNLKYERNTTISMLAQLPNIEYIENGNLIRVRVDRPDKAFGYESLVKRSGDDSTLLGDWDVGGQYAITNTRDVTIANKDGTQKLVSAGLTNVYTVGHGTKLKKPSCPIGFQPDISLAISYIKVLSGYSLAGSVKPYLMQEGTDAQHWKVGIVTMLHDNEEFEFIENRDSEVQATIYCKKDGTNG